MILKIKPPCPKCPYKTGIIKTLINLCSHCKENAYQSFEWFQKNNKNNRILKSESK